MDALLTIDENWRPTSDGWVSSPWAPLGGPTKNISYEVPLPPSVTMVGRIGSTSPRENELLTHGE